MARHVVALMAILATTLVAAKPALATSSTADWPTIQGDLGRTGFRGEIDGPGDGSVVWKAETDDLVIRTPPAAANGRVFVVTHGGTIYALKARTGEVDWTNRGTAQVSTGAVVSGGLVYVADEGGTLRAVDESTGRAVWNRTFGARPWTPSACDDVLYFGVRGQLLALDAETGGTHWTRDLATILGQKRSTSTSGPPLCLGDSIIFGTSAETVTAVDRREGALLWSGSIDGDAYGPLATDGTAIYAGTQRGSLHALDASNGSSLWVHHTDFDGVRPPSVSGGVVYRTGFEHVFAVDARTGVERWSYRLPSGSDTHVTLTPTAAIYASHDGSVTALSVANGTPIWSRRIAAFIGDSTPIVVDGFLYVGTEQYRVFALDAGADVPDQEQPSVPAQRPPRNVDSPTPSMIATALLVAFGLMRRQR